jgi:hypothetical protein
MLPGLQSRPAPWRRWPQARDGGFRRAGALNIGNRGGALLALAFVVAEQPAHRLIAFVAVALLSAYYRPLGRTAVSSRPLEEGSPA